MRVQKNFPHTLPGSAWLWCWCLNQDSVLICGILGWSCISTQLPSVLIFTLSSVCVVNQMHIESWWWRHCQLLTHHSFFFHSLHRPGTRTILVVRVGECKRRCCFFPQGTCILSTIEKNVSYKLADAKNKSLPSPVLVAANGGVFFGSVFRSFISQRPRDIFLLLLTLHFSEISRWISAVSKP